LDPGGEEKGMTGNGEGSGLGHYILGQARNNFWSNHRLHKACSALSRSEYFDARPSFFGSIHAHLDHIVFVDWLYLERLTGKSLLPTDIGEFLHPERASLMEDQSAADRALIDFCQSADSEILVSTVTFKLLNGSQYTETAANVLAHLFTHQIHHRGQVHGMLSATSVDPPQLDEFFFQSELPLREAELRTLGLPME
jgi:uncharacterized damage-inducible protein DinB